MDQAFKDLIIPNKLMQSTQKAARLISNVRLMSNPGKKKERGHTYTPDNGGAVRLVAAEEMKQSKSVGMLERELGA